MRDLVNNVDHFMRIGHVGIFGLVLLVRYIKAIEHEPDYPTCDNVMQYFDGTFFDRFNGISET